MTFVSVNRELASQVKSMELSFEEAMRSRSVFTTPSAPSFPQTTALSSACVPSVCVVKSVSARRRSLVARTSIFLLEHGEFGANIF